MSLISNDKYYIPFNKSQIIELPLELMKPFEISILSIEKCLIKNGKILKKEDIYPIIEFKSKDKEKIEELNYSKNYIPFNKGYYELNYECYFYKKNKINILIIMPNNEIKINDMNKLLFYIINNCHDKGKYISIEVILGSLEYGEFRPYFLLHDKPYHLYDDYVSKNKEEYEKFIKRLNNIYKILSINLREIKNIELFRELNIYPFSLPQFIIYDKNYRILYKDNLFQETPERLEEICKIINDKIENPFNDKLCFRSLMKKCPITVKSFFDKIEKNIQNNMVLKNENEFIEEREKLIKKLREETSKKENIGKSCKVYFTKKYQSLTKEQLNSINGDIKELSKFENIKSIYLKPIICINYDFKNGLLLPFMQYEDTIFPKKFRNQLNYLLYYTWKGITSFCSNNNINNHEIEFKTIKYFTNLKFYIARELNVIYKNGLDFYYIPMNFATLFMDKTKYFNINLKAKLIPHKNYKLKYKDFNHAEKELEIKLDEITIFQCFREDLCSQQCDLGGIISKFKEENKNVKIRYYPLILTPGDQLKNSIFFDKIKACLDSFTNVDDILSFSYVIEEFHELTKYISSGTNLYIFGLKNEVINFELVPDSAEKSKELLKYYINKLLLKSYEKEISKNQYKLLKSTWKDFLKLKEDITDRILIEIELTKIKYFDNKETKYIFKCYNHEKKIWDNDKGKNKEQIKELTELKNKINKILEQQENIINKINI